MSSLDQNLNQKSFTALGKKDGIERYVDEAGQVVFTANGYINFVLQGYEGEVLISDPELSIYNKHRCDHPYSSRILPEIKEYKPIEDVKSFHELRKSQWMIPEHVFEIDVYSALISMCENQDQIDRVNIEWNMYQKRNLIPTLQVLAYIVSIFISKDIIIGVGRGSSVSSYILYKLGVHRIDSMEYELDIHDFLR